MGATRVLTVDAFLERRHVVRATLVLALGAAVAPLFVTVALIDVAGALLLAAGTLRLAHGLTRAHGAERFAGVTTLVLGAALMTASGEGAWSLPVLFAVYLGVEAVLRLVQAVRHDNLRLYSAGLLAGLVALGIWQEVFCGGYGLFGPLVGLDLAAAAWAYADVPRAG